MTVAFVQQVQASQLGGVSTWDAPAFTPGAGSLLVCMVTYDRAAGAVTITLSDTTGSNGTWTATGDTQYNGNFGTASFYLTNAAATSSTIRATYSSAIDILPAIYVAEFSGASTAAALAHVTNLQATPGTGTDAITSGLSGTLGSQPALIFGFTFGYTNSSTGTTAGTGYTGLTAVWDYALGGNTFAKPEWQRVTATTSIAATFTDAVQGGSNTWQTYLMAFAEAAANTLKTAIGLADASIKTFTGLAKASTKTVVGLTP